VRLSDAGTLDESGVTDQNYLRGVQETDANGQVSFTTIFPACYSGRRPHIHFELYPGLAAATDEANKIATRPSACRSDKRSSVGPRDPSRSNPPQVRE
jgi:protocatechuate 3,4-dioxygenase beta subunit